MKVYYLLCIATALFPLSYANAVNRVATFDSAPTFELPLESLQTVLQAGEWGTVEDGLDNNVAGDINGPTPVPIWNPGGWLQPIGFETSTNHRIAIGPNPIGVNENAILANLNTGVIVFDDTSWGNVSSATHVTMDVKGSFAGSGGITVLLAHDGDITPIPSTPSAIPYWSWAAGASAVSVGLNPGDVSEWTTILIPINKPQPDGSAPNGEDGTWGTFGQVFTDQGWNTMLSDVNSIQIAGLTPDTQIDNLGFVLPETGIDGDYNNDGTVNAADYTAWLDNLGAPAGTLPNDGDGGVIGQAQYDTWKANFGTGGSASASNSAIPEPYSAWLFVCGLMTLLGAWRQVRR